MSRHRLDAYRLLLQDLETRIPPGDLVDRMESFAGLAWSHLRDTGISWLGFYLVHDSDPDSMVLGPRRDRPGLHGVCGRSLRTGRSMVGDDVLELGSDYVACDPRDRAEIVIPLACGASGPHPADLVLDLDSFEPGAFSDEDDRCLRACLLQAGFQPVGCPGSESEG